MLISQETSPKALPLNDWVPGRMGEEVNEPSALDFLNALNPPQREAASHVDGPLIVLAGAGSGKTKMLTSRVAALMVGQNVPGHQILAVTFTNKAAREMRERVERTLHQLGGSFWSQPEIGTFHSICVRILRREAHRTPFTKPFVIYDDSDQLSLVKDVVQKLGLDEKSFSPKGFQARINRLKCDALGPEDIEPKAHDVYERQLKRVYEQYQQDLFANNALDFGEILCMAYRLFRDHPDVRAKYQRLYRFVHVDEYQDTNRSQYLLLSMLCAKTHGGHGNICVVGDEDQSIYKWRGADIRNILDFESDYPGAKIVKLEQNYRSTQTIITAAGQVIRNNTQRRDKTLWTENEKGTPVARYQLPDERAEAEMVIGEIKRLAREENRTFDEFAIFYRTHAQSRQFEDVFRREKIAYQIVGGLRFYDRKEIKDILSYLKAIMNPADSISLKRIINVPARGIGKTTLDKIESHWINRQADNPRTTYWDALVEAASDPNVLSGSTSKKIRAFTDLMFKLGREQPKLLLSELYHLILDDTHYVEELRKEGTEEAQARIENLEELDSLLLEFEEDFFETTPQGTSEEEQAARRAELLPQFLEQSSLATDTEGKGSESGVASVTMMTLHSSKGLEYPVVFLPGMEEGLFPSVRAWEEAPDEEIEEERRLCYVGMTRARERLYLTHVMIRRLWGQVHYQEPARFFQEIDESLVEFRDLSQSGAGFRAGSSRQFGFGGGRRLESHDFSQVAEDASQALKGKNVQHPSYGRGRIVEVEGSGEDAKVVIEFASRDRRKFLVRFIQEMIQ
jgi:DNA helicase-2/ATP-dependent DNA helicase PcrA